MKNVFCYEIKPRREDYRLEILRKNPPELFFELGFAETEKDRMKCYANITGFNPLDSYCEMPSKVALEIIILLLKGVISAVDRYMLPWDYVIDTGTVYTDRKGERVKILYKPTAKKQGIKYIPEGTTSSIMLSFVKDFVNKVSADERSTFLRVMELFFKEEKSPEDCLRSLYRLRSKLGASLDLSK